MTTRRTLFALLAASLLTVHGAAQAPPAYLFADGSSEGALGVAGGGEVAWLVGHDTGGGTDSLTAVHVAWGCKAFVGSAPPNGTPAMVYVWDDTDNDGDPRTGLVLVNQTPTTVANVDTDLLNLVPLSSPAAVTDGFFIGASIDHVDGQFPGPIDTSMPSAGRAWLTGSPAANGFNPNDLNDPGHIGVFDLDTIGFSGVWMIGAGNQPLDPVTYCTAKTNSCGGTPALSTTGASSAASSGGFVVSAAGARGGDKVGLLIYTDQGRRVPAAAFGGGFLCIVTVRRGPLQLSGGTPGICDGVFALDMNAFAQGQAGGNPQPFLSVPGTVIDCQYWGRDTFAHGDFLTGALEYTVLP